jgi:beta-N-acetylhexosaminidase
MQVAALGRAWLDGMRDGGVTGIVKHMPGHGRAAVDSHHGLPVVEAGAEELEADVEPFRSLNWAPVAMTAHVLFTAWDAQAPATLSASIISEVIRGGIGFAGLLLSDDIVMEALAGPHGARAVAALEAGCDLVLHCSGVLAQMKEVAAALPEIGGEARQRLERAVAWAPAPAEAADCRELTTRRDALLAYA